MRAPARYRHLTGIGTTVVAAAPTTLVRVVIGTEAAGETIALHDVATAGAAGPGNLIASIKTDTRGTYDLGAYCAAGLVAIVSGGASDITIVAG